jgi:hypothetical protein
LKQDGSYLGVKPEGHLFRCCAVFKAFHLLSKVGYFQKSLFWQFLEGQTLSPLAGRLAVNRDSKKRCPFCGAPH